MINNITHRIMKTTILSYSNVKGSSILGSNFGPLFISNRVRARD